MDEISKTYHIAASVSAVWQALVDPAQIVDWTGETAVMRAEEGFEFTLWGGDIWGTNTKVVPEQSLFQDWYGGQWDKPSKVEITLTPETKGTKIDLKHYDFPADQRDDFVEGWDEYYFGAIKEYLENEPS